EMPTVDFFAWDIVAGNRHILGKVLKLIRSRIYQFWWSVPRLIDAMRSPYEIVLPAQGWPKGAFKDMPPTRSYRLHYLRDTLHGLAAPDEPDCATIATEYRDTLALPSPDAAPPLP